MNTSGFSRGDHGFDILDLKARFAFKTGTSISFDIGRWSNTLRLPSAEGNEEFVWSEDRPFVFNVVGWIDVHHPCDGHIKAQIRVGIPDEYHSFDRVKGIVETILKALEIPPDETYEATAFNCDNGMVIIQPIGPNGVPGQFYV
jgi:hypothetical protein